MRKRHKWPSKSNNSVTLFRFTEIDGGLSVSEGAAQFADLLVALHIQTAERKITMKMRILLNKMVLNGTLLALGALAPLAGAAPSFKSFRIPTANSEPEGITLGPDGNMWFTEAAANQIGRIDLKGNITEFVVPQPLSSPVDIVSGADGALWFTEESGFPEGIGRVTTGGVFTGFAPDCGGGQPCSLTPRGIAATADGLIWFTDSNSNSIVKLDPATAIMTFFSIPSNGRPTDITLGPDGALWFCEGIADQIGQLRCGGGVGMMGMNRHGHLQGYEMASDTTSIAPVWPRRFTIDCGSLTSSKTSLAGSPPPV